MIDYESLHHQLSHSGSLCLAKHDTSPEPYCAASKQLTNFEQLRIYKSATMPSSSDGVDASASSDTSPGQLDLLDSVLETAGRDGSLLLASVRYLLLPWFLWQAILFSED